ncbi:hypothetical protein HK099_000017 [Clydaea vesicula]|uniref:Uncharacterized protein n=1 Tax=Clydaea vesicula TaxID=447962 RepID=A0AAD5UBX8_9FUNG|nr:hypothetical protein HK099_000017 [Clydaea vesicula]
MLINSSLATLVIIATSSLLVLSAPSSYYAGDDNYVQHYKHKYNRHKGYSRYHHKKHHKHHKKKYYLSADATDDEDDEDQDQSLTADSKVASLTSSSLTVYPGKPHHKGFKGWPKYAPKWATKYKWKIDKQGTLTEIFTGPQKGNFGDRKETWITYADGREEKSAVALRADDVNEDDATSEQSLVSQQATVYPGPPHKRGSKGWPKYAPKWARRYRWTLDSKGTLTEIFTGPQKGNFGDRTETWVTYADGREEKSAVALNAEGSEAEQSLTSSSVDAQELTAYPGPPHHIGTKGWPSYAPEWARDYKWNLDAEGTLTEVFSSPQEGNFGDRTETWITYKDGREERNAVALRPEAADFDDDDDDVNFEDDDDDDEDDDEGDEGDENEQSLNSQDSYGSYDSYNKYRSKKHYGYRKHYKKHKKHYYNKDYGY